jgi:hypothetical protein
MARKNEEDITRLYMSNAYVTKPQYDDKGNQTGVVPVEYASKDWDKQVNEMLKALQSATNGLARVTSKVDEFGNALATFDVPSNMNKPANAAFENTLTGMEAKYGYTEGSLALDPYDKGVPEEEKFKRIQFHKDMHGSLAKSRAKRALKNAGGLAEEDPSKAHPDRMRMSFDVPEEEWEAAVKNKGGDVSKARQHFIRKFTSANLKEAEGYSKLVSDKKREEAEEKEKEKEKKDKEKEEKEKEQEEKKEKSDSKTSRRKMFRTLATVAAVVTAVVDITRRILTAVLDRGSQIRQESGDAKKLGISYSDIREYKAQEQSMGLRQGIFTGAIGSLQSAFGDITNLDEGALSELAKVLQGNVIEAINQGLGKSDPQKLLGLILDTYYKRGEQGVNSIGQNVGHYQAERELSTALEKAGLTDVADILRNMFYTNDTGIYKGRIDVDKAFQSYMNLITAYTGGQTAADFQNASELGQVIDDLKKKFNELKENLETGLLRSLSHVINSLWNMRVGQSPSENLTTSGTNRQSNEAVIARLTPSIARNKAAYSHFFKDVRFANLGLQGVNDFDSFLKYIKAHPNADIDFSSGEGAKIASILSGENASDIYSMILRVEAEEKRLEQAKKNLEKGERTGTIDFQPSDFTEAGIEVLEQDLLKWHGNMPGQLAKNSAARLLQRQASGRVMPTGMRVEDLMDMDAEAMYNKYKETYGDFSLNKFMAIVDDGGRNANAIIPRIAQGLLQLPAGDVLNQLTSNVGRKRRNESDLSYAIRIIKEAKRLRLLNPDTFSDIALPLFKEGLRKGMSGYGLTEEAAGLMRDYGQELAWTSLLKNNPLLESVNEIAEQFAGEMNDNDLRGHSSVKAEATKFDERTKELTVRMVIQTPQGHVIREKEYSFASDAASSAIVGETIDVTGMFSNPNAAAPGGS